MKAIILAAGYATRLYPLTLNQPKALLPIGGQPIIDSIVSQINAIDAVNEIYVVTNHKFVDHFEQWAKEVKSNTPIVVLDDGTLTEETRLGAIGDINFVIEQKKIDDDLLVIAGDNFFTYRLEDYYAFFKSKNKDCVCVKKWEDTATLNQFGIALLDDNAKVLDIEEKPENPKSNTVVFATYMYLRETVPLFAKYLEEGNKPDAPGYFPAWLYKRKDVYAYTFSGECYDVGTHESYREVCALYE